MVIKPKIRGFICTNAHPTGCSEHVQEQINYVKQQGALKNAPKNQEASQSFMSMNSRP